MSLLHLHLRGFALAALPLVALCLLTTLASVGLLDWGVAVGGAYFLGHITFVLRYGRRSPAPSAKKER